MTSDNRDDKVTLGLTPAADRNLQDLMETGWFENEIDVFKLAIALALREGTAASPEEMVGVGTKWSVAIDADRRISSMVRLLGDEDTSRPYALAERYAVAGLVYLHRRLVLDQVLLAEVMVIGNPEEGD